MTEIYSGPVYTIDSQGNGARVTITRVADGASVFLQDEDAFRFIDRVEHAYDTGGVDTPLHDLCAEHDELIVGGRGMTTGELSLDYIGRRLDDLQREAKHHRLLMDLTLAETKALRAEFEAQRAELQAHRARMNVIDNRLDRMDQHLDRIEQKLDLIVEKLP